MIPNQWYAILESHEVPAGRPVGATRLGERLVFWRPKPGEVACLRDQCVHRGAALSLGELHEDQLACPFHGLRYDASGQVQLIPANGRNTPVPAPFRVLGYPAREAHGFIWLWWGEPRPDLPPIPFFDSLDAGFNYATYVDTWPVHYSRAIENQLDVAHLPFVHYNTIGRGHKTLVDGPFVEAFADGLDLYVFNRVDDGTLPRRPEEIPDPHSGFLLHFRFPNIWQNHVSADVRIVAAFAPIDETHTRMYLRFYQRSVRVPIVRELFAWLGAAQGNRIIASQDKRVVSTQVPPKSELHMGEKLFQADRPIVEYRRRREELMRET